MMQLAATDTTETLEPTIPIGIGTMPDTVDHLGAWEIRNSLRGLLLRSASSDVLRHTYSHLRERLVTYSSKAINYCNERLRTATNTIQRNATSITYLESRVQRLQTENSKLQLDSNALEFRLRNAETRLHKINSIPVQRLQFLALLFPLLLLFYHLSHRHLCRDQHKRHRYHPPTAVPAR